MISLTASQSDITAVRTLNLTVNGMIPTCIGLALDSTGNLLYCTDPVHGIIILYSRTTQITSIFSGQC